jgi:hypothetical protein
MYAVIMFFFYESKCGHGGNGKDFFVPPTYVLLTYVAGSPSNGKDIVPPAHTSNCVLQVTDPHNIEKGGAEKIVNIHYTVDSILLSTGARCSPLLALLWFKGGYIQNCDAGPRGLYIGGCHFLILF